MAINQKTYKEVESTKETFVDVYCPIAGWKAKVMGWNEEGFWECLQTGFFAFATKEKAIRDAKTWAEAEELTYVE